MFRSILLLGAAGTALLTAAPALAQEATENVTVTAQKLAAARNGIQTQTGASTYTVTAKDIQAQPGGELQGVRGPPPLGHGGSGRTDGGDPGVR